MKVLLYGLGVMLAVVSVLSSAHAGQTVRVPEIGPDSAAAVLGLVSAGILVLRARRK